MDRYYHLYDRDGDEYRFGVWREIDILKWERRGQTVPVNEVPAEAAVGDVLLDYPPRTPRNEVDIADPEIADQIQTEIATYEQQVEAMAQKHDIDLGTELQSLEDGDVLLPSLSHRTVSPSDWDNQIYGSTEGLISDSMTYGVDFDAIINCAPAAIEPGMVFDVLDDAEYLYGFRYDQTATANLKQEPAEIRRFRSIPKIIDRLDGAESRADLEPPFYVQIRTFDDGWYGASLYDSGTEEDPRGIYYVNYRHLADAEAKPPYKIRAGWTKGKLLPVDSLYFDEADHPEAPIALIAPDAEPVDAEQANTYK